MAYFLLKSFFYLLSLLPFWVIYRLSDLAAFLLNRVIGYRKKVIFDNLSKAFPEKSAKEIRSIQAGFYRNFCDVIFEFLKLMSISPAELKRRVVPENPEVIPQMIDDGQGSVVIFGHHANWEWNGAGMGLHLPFDTYGIYKPLSNSLFDRLTLHLRIRLANTMIPQAQAYRQALTLLRKPTAIAFLSDQNPVRTPEMYFTPFMGRLAPMHLGIATIALKMDRKVWYFDIQRLKRGHYSVRIVPVSTEGCLPASPENIRKFTDRIVQQVEASIRKAPADWLWSHRRWKHSPREGDITGPQS